MTETPAQTDGNSLHKVSFALRIFADKNVEAAVKIQLSLTYIAKIADIQFCNGLFVLFSCAFCGFGCCVLVKHDLVFLALEFDCIAWLYLLAALGAELAVNGEFTQLHKYLSLCAGLSESGKFNKLIQLYKRCYDLDFFHCSDVPFQIMYGTHRITSVEALIHARRSKHRMRRALYFSRCRVCRRIR